MLIKSLRPNPIFQFSEIQESNTLILEKVKLKLSDIRRLHRGWNRGPNREERSLSGVNQIFAL